MSKVATVGSKLNDPAGVITEGLSWCKVNGKPITYVGATGTTHGGFAGGGFGSGAGAWMEFGGHSWGPNPDGGGGGWVEGGPEHDWWINWDADMGDYGGGIDNRHFAGTWVITTGSSFFKAGGRRVAVVGSETSCGHVVATGEFVNVGGSIGGVYGGPGDTVP